MEPDYELENTLIALDLERDLRPDGSFTQASSRACGATSRGRTPARCESTTSRASANLEEWLAIHEERHREIGATPLPRQLFRAALAHMVPVGRARFFFVRRVDDGEMVAGWLLPATRRRGRCVHAVDAQPSRASCVPTICSRRCRSHWARRAGARFYNWQASPPEGGVRRFKQQWGGRDHAYSFLTRVTGSAERLLAADPAELAAGYPWHFVLPYDRLGARAGSDAAASRRDSAWRALEARKR